MDEYNKVSSNTVITERSREAGQERRHHPVTWVVNGQRPSGMDAAFMGQATIVVCFRLSSRKEIRVVKDRCGALDEVPDETFMNLRHGQCIIAAMQSTSEDSVYGVKIRAAVTHAGKETKIKSPSIKPALISSSERFRNDSDDQGQWPVWLLPGYPARDNAAA